MRAASDSPQRRSGPLDDPDRGPAPPLPGSGVEGIAYLRERDVHSLVARAAADGGDIGKLEATGVQNFLDLDDLPVTEEGEPVHAQSIISLPLASGRCVLPPFNPSPDDPFLQRVNASGKKWVIVTDLAGEPAFVLDSHHFLRDALFDQPETIQGACWHRPIRAGFKFTWGLRGSSR